MDEAYIGQMMMFGGNFAIRAWAFCDGQLLPISQNNALFSILGTTYGGDGRTTFGLPDLRGRVAIHPGSGPGLSSYRQGEKGGQEYVTLNYTEIPSHNHSEALNVNSTAAVINTPAPGVSIAAPGVSDGRTTTPALGFNTSAPDVTLNPNSIMTMNSGGNLDHTNEQPYLGVYHLICLQGIYPSRS